MPRQYKKKTYRCKYGTSKLNEALLELEKGRSVKSVSKQYDIPGRTLRRHRDGKIQSPGSLGQGRKQYIPHAVETTIADHLKDMNSRLFGLSLM